MRETDVVIFFVVIGVLVALFLLLREVMCWYYKINKRLEVAEETAEYNRKILKVLTEISEKLVNKEQEKNKPQ